MKEKNNKTKEKNKMKEKNETKEKNNKTKHTIEIISLVFSIISIVFSSVIGFSQYRLADRSAEFEKTFYPINYIITLGDEKFTLKFSDDNNNNYSLSQCFPSIEFVTGKPHKVAVITQNNDNYNISSLAIPPGDYIIKNIKTDIPQKDLKYEMGYAYDYFFLYLEDANGNYIVDLVYYEIDLINRTVSEPKSYSKIDLLKINESNSNTNEIEMLNNYKELLNRISELDT